MRCFNDILEPTGITVDQLRQSKDGVKYPVSAKSTRHYETDGFQTPSGKVEIKSSVLEQYGYEPLPVYREPAESPISTPELVEKYPLILTTGARTVSYTHSQHRNLKRLRKMVPEPLLEIHPDDAETRGIKPGEKVSIMSPRGAVSVRVHITDTILPGVVHLPHHWPDDANANILCDDQNLDPISGFPAFKSQLCQVKPIS
jgi:anaerobic selenocysteine-containing dehydrogenase